MILNVYAYFNEHLLAYGNFQLDDHTPEQVCSSLTRDLRAKYLENNVANLSYLKLYCLGTFNDETGEFTNKKELVLDLGVALEQLKVAFEKEKAEKKQYQFDDKKEGDKK